MEKITFTPEDIQICSDFAEKMDTSLYAKRNQSDENKRRLDSKLGKMAELAVYYALKEPYPNISYPDFNIYKPREKSWDYDLKVPDQKNIHVKGQDYLSAMRYSESWVFQNEDKHIFKTYTDKDYVVFVLLNYLQKHATIRAILPVSLLHEKQLFKKMVLPHLTSKSAVYYEDIKLLPEQFYL
jgi:hypothetical protein